MLIDAAAPLALQVAGYATLKYGLLIALNNSAFHKLHSSWHEPGDHIVDIRVGEATLMAGALTGGRAPPLGYDRPLDLAARLRR